MAEHMTPGTWAARLCGWRRVAPQFAGLALLLMLVGRAGDILFAPWAYSFGLWPTLTGRWAGSTMSNGIASAMFMELQGGMESGSGPNRASIDGRALWCDGTGAIREYRLWGAPGNWRGTVFDVSMIPTSEPRAGRSLAEVRGRWDRHAIAAEALMVLSAGNAPATAVASEDAPSAEGPDVRRYLLRRGTEADFRAACRQMDGAAEPPS